ncbi:MAG TPA: hypothetical protein VHC73_08645 [Vitreimonas sp.]|nr:hypothetical protein [Vitreimonas sp.]
MTTAPGRYEGLRADRILATLEQLRARILARFPDSGLSKVCAELISVGQWSANDAAALSKPSYAWRALVALVIVAGVAAQIAAASRFLKASSFSSGGPELLQALEAAVNLLILFGGAAWFLITLEERIKRQRALDALHRLRSLAHVVDMHQLTKDPTVLLTHQATAASPQRAMSRFELTRYLDYSAEMLALIGKLAALYSDRMRDSVVIEAVSDLENLAANLGRKIWQKIMILSALEEPGG